MVAAQRPVQVLAAGSLRQAMDALARSFAAAHGAATVQSHFGASGLLKERIESGAASADVFASANMEHPQALHIAGKSAAPLAFTRNRMCLLMQPGFALGAPEAPAQADALLDLMLTPSLRLGTSTPGADPAGDYAWRVFARAESLRPGSRVLLEAKALQLTGGPNSARAPAGQTTYAWLMEERHADLFLTYCTNAKEAQSLVPSLRIAELPPTLQVEAVYGIAALKPAGQVFVDFVLSDTGQTVLQRFGFSRR